MIFQVVYLRILELKKSIDKFAKPTIFKISITELLRAVNMLRYIKNFQETIINCFSHSSASLLLNLSLKLREHNLGKTSGRLKNLFQDKMPEIECIQRKSIMLQFNIIPQYNTYLFYSSEKFVCSRIVSPWIC